LSSNARTTWVVAVSSEAAARTLAENYVGLAAERYAGSVDGVAQRIGPIGMPR